MVPVQDLTSARPLASEQTYLAFTFLPFLKLAPSFVVLRLTGGAGGRERRVADREGEYVPAVGDRPPAVRPDILGDDAVAHSDRSGRLIAHPRAQAGVSGGADQMRRTGACSTVASTRTGVV